MANPSSNQPTATMSMSVDDLASRFVKKVWRQGRESLKPKDAKQASRPWEPWELDEDFFRALSQWTLENPDTPLDRILDKIRDSLESFHDLFQSIPDSPFPARGLVIALAHLLKLGITVRRAQKDVQDFAKDVIRWVGLVKSAFESAGKAKEGQFGYRAWRDFRHMRELVDKMCLWAVERLDDGRWSRIGHGLMIQKEIREFNERIANARALFQDLSAINMARGLDAVMGKLRSLVLSQQTIVGEIQELRKTQKRQFKRIMSELETQKQVAERERFFAQTLNIHAIASPTYDTQGKRPCDEDTRIEVLDEIQQWRDDIRHGSPNFLWLTGDPGCGKSAVTASFARKCKDEGVLWAQFFINRNNVETTDPRSYFPSIARQLADYSTEVAKSIHHTLIKQRSLTDDISPDQAAYLFTSSIRKASELDPDRPVVVVIDGLDETKRNRLDDTAKVFSTLFTTLEAYSNVKVFISSRTENEIQKSFVLPQHDNHIKRVHLDTADPFSIRDVSHYIKRNLLNLVREHDLNWDVWPGEDRSRLLGQRASGLFIWGVTVIKFIQEQLDLNGEECLDEVLDMLTADALGDINALYTLILKVKHEGLQDKWELERFRRIIGTIIFLQEPLCIDDLAALLDLRKTPSSRAVDIIHFVRRFRTILVTGTDAISGSTVPRIHKSVYEFITSNSVDARFRVEPEHAHLELGMQCLRHLGGVRNFLIPQDALPAPFRYAIRFWLSHVLQAKPMGICADNRHAPAMSPFSLSAMSEPSATIHKPIRVQYSALYSQIKAASTQESHIWDADSGRSISHTHNIMCLVFSPDGKQIVSCSLDRTIKVWNSTNGALIRTFAKYPTGFYTIAFSPAGRFVVSGSDDGLACLWDYSTGALMEKPFQGHKGPISCVAFSPDGEQIVSGSWDKTCTLWNAESRLAAGRPWIGHAERVELVSFSSSGKWVCSVDSKGHGIVWGVETGQIRSRWEYPGHPTCLSFSPRDDSVIAVGGQIGIRIHRNDEGQRIFGSGDTECLSFLANGKELLFSDHDSVGIVEVGNDSKSTHIVKRGSYRRPDRIRPRKVAVSFDHVAWADSRNRLQVYALRHHKSSLEALSVSSDWTFTTSQTLSEQELMDVLSSMKEAQHSHQTAVNSRLDGTEWYEVDIGFAQSSVKRLELCLVTDDAVVAGYVDGSVSSWEQRAYVKQSAIDIHRSESPQY